MISVTFNAAAGLTVFIGAMIVATAAFSGLMRNNER